MRILSRYLVSRFFALFAAMLIAATLAIIIVEMLLNFDDMIRVQKGAAGIASYLLLRIPSYYLRDLVPVAAAGAAFLTLGLAARWHETTALKAGGIAVERVLAPLLLAVAATALLSAVLNETWVLSARRAWVSERRSGAVFDFGSESFWHRRGEVIYNVHAADKARRELLEVAVFTRSPEGRLLRSVRAARARVDAAGRWHLFDARILDFAASDTEAVPRASRVAEWIESPGGDEAVAWQSADANLLDLASLRRYRDAEARHGRSQQRLEALLHTRLSEPVALLVLAGLALPLGLSVERSRSLGGPALWAGAALLLFFLVRNVSHTLAAEGVIPAASGPWSGVAVMGAIATWLVWRAPR